MSTLKFRLSRPLFPLSSKWRWASLISLITGQHSSMNSMKWAQFSRYRVAKPNVSNNHSRCKSPKWCLCCLLSLNVRYFNHLLYVSVWTAVHPYYVLCESGEDLDRRLALRDHQRHPGGDLELQAVDQRHLPVRGAGHDEHVPHGRLLHLLEEGAGEVPEGLRQTLRQTHQIRLRRDDRHSHQSHAATRWTDELQL